MPFHDNDKDSLGDFTKPSRQKNRKGHRHKESVEKAQKAPYRRQRISRDDVNRVLNDDFDENFDEN